MEKDSRYEAIALEVSKVMKDVVGWTAYTQLQTKIDTVKEVISKKRKLHENAEMTGKAVRHKQTEYEIAQSSFDTQNATQHKLKEELRVLKEEIAERTKLRGKMSTADKSLGEALAKQATQISETASLIEDLVKENDASIDQVGKRMATFHTGIECLHDAGGAIDPFGRQDRRSCHDHNQRSGVGG